MVTYKYMLAPQSLDELQMHISKDGCLIHIKTFTRGLSADGNRIGNGSETDWAFAHRARAWAQEYIRNLKIADNKLEEFKKLCRIRNLV